jgi:large subunit ribosomal protein L14e
MYEIGRLVVKIAGRDAGQTGIVVDKVDDNIVLIDGNVRRKKCNIKHLEPLKDVLKIKKGASTSEVHKIMSAAGMKVVEQKKVKRSPKKKKEEVKKTKKISKK